MHEREHGSLVGNALRALAVAVAVAVAFGTMAGMTTGDEEQVLQAAEQRAAALVAADPDELRRLLHPRLRWTTFLGDVLSRDQYVAGNTSGAILWRSQRLEQPHVEVVGDTAVLTAVAVDDVSRPGQDGEVRLRLTQTWVREGDQWRCLAGHAGPQV